MAPTRSYALAASEAQLWNNNCCSGPERSRRLEIRDAIVVAAVVACSPGQVASRAIQHNKRGAISTGRYRADDHTDRALAVHIRRHYRNVDARHRSRVALPSGGGARTAGITALHGERAKGRGKRGAIEIHPHLIQLVRRRPQ